MANPGKDSDFYVT